MRNRFVPVEPVVARGGHERGYPSVRPYASGSGEVASRAATYRTIEGCESPIVAETPGRYGRDAGARALDLDRQLRALTSADGAARRVLGLLVDRFAGTRGFERLGFARLDDYSAERLGWSGRQLRDIARVAVALARLPATERAFRSGVLDWSKARLLASVVSADDEERWLEVAVSTDSRTLAILTANARTARREEFQVSGAGPMGTRDEHNATSEIGADDDEEQERVLLRIPCSRRAIRMWQEARRLAPRLVGRSLAPWQVAQAVAAEASSAPGRFAEVWEQEPWRSLASQDGECGKARGAVDEASCAREDGLDRAADGRAAVGSAGNGTAIGSADDRAADDGAVVDGAVVDGAVVDGAVVDGAATHGAATHGAADDGAADDGAADDGAADDGAADDYRTSAGRASTKGTAEAASDDLGAMAGDRAAEQRSRATAARRTSVEEHADRASMDVPDCPFERELEDLGQLDARGLDAAMRRVRATMQRRHAQLGASLAIVLEARLYRDLGYSSFAAYVTESLGIPERTARELVRVTRGAGRSGGALAAAWSRGELTWLQTLTLLPVAKTWNAVAWTRRAGEVTLRRLADEVDWAVEQMDVDPQRAAAMPPPPNQDLARDRQRCADAASRTDGADGKTGGGGSLHANDPRDRQRCADAASRTDEVGGRTGGGSHHANDPRDRQTCADTASANEVPRWSRDEFFGVLGRFRVTILAPKPVSRQFRSIMQAFAHPTEPRWLAFERMLEQVLLEWRRQPRHRDPVFERDEYRCTAPGCSSRCNLHDHHIVPRSLGGTNDLANRTTLCAWHHLRGIHGGLASATGDAPDGIDWELGVDADGTSFLQLRGDRYRAAREAT